MELTTSVIPHADRSLLLQVLDFGFSFALFYATSKGLGLHDADIALDARGPLSRANYAFTVLYVS